MLVGFVVGAVVGVVSGAMLAVAFPQVFVVADWALDKLMAAYRAVRK